MKKKLTKKTMEVRLLPFENETWSVEQWERYLEIHLFTLMRTGHQTPKFDFTKTNGKLMQENKT